MEQQNPNRHLSRASSLRRLLPHVTRRRQSSIASFPNSSIAASDSISETTSWPEDTILRRGSRAVLAVTSANWLPREEARKSSSHLWEFQFNPKGSNNRLEEEGKTATSRSWDIRKQFGGYPSQKRRSVLQTMRTPNLGINVSREPDRGPSPLSSPRTPHTPHSPFNQSSIDGQGGNDINQASSPNVPRQSSPNPAKKSFFSNKTASRSTTRLPKSGSPTKTSSTASPKPPSSMASVYNMNRGMGSSPELTISDASGNVFTENPSSANDQGSYSQSESLVPQFHQAKKKPSKHKFILLGRKGSIKDEDSHAHEISNMQRTNRGLREPGAEKVVKASALRNHSVDTVVPEEPRAQSSNSREQNSSSHGIRHTGTRAADGLGRAAKGIFGKLSSRSNGTNESSREQQERTAKAERDAADAQRAFLTKTYKIIHEPLEVQARTTRICKRLEECKDKTEFWLPALAYRCIDYLNDKGMAHEGLYRVPGSEREIRNWIWRFDNEHDIDLLSEEDLYDINTISSMFKAWLRDLPDEVFPKSIQHKISATVSNLNEHPDAPEMLKTELSKLPPFNYYLLFAVTAHITMLLNASKENKMTFHNLCVCFMPALKMELPCFQWLILDWKNCWQGCWTEKDYLLREYAIQNKVDEEEAVASQSIPIQHFDRYPPPHARSFESNHSSAGREHDQVGSMSSSLPSENPSDNLKTVNPAKRQQDYSRAQQERQTGSPVKTKPSDSTTTTPSVHPSNSRRGKKPVPLESALLGSRRRDSEASLRQSKPDKELSEEQNHTSRSESRDGSTQDEPAQPDSRKRANKGGTLLPELSPVQPLSPFGTLDTFSR